MERMLIMFCDWVKKSAANRARSVTIEMSKPVIVVRLKDKDTLTGKVANYDIALDMAQIDAMHEADEFIMTRINNAFEEISKATKERKAK